ncbi:MAG: hypothetical protein JWN81_2922, partial [Solirubrobacterales bacterium]|nr:hypothetical protein [Solirubrobacterales bacterium]
PRCLATPKCPTTEAVSGEPATGGAPRRLGGAEWGTAVRRGATPPRFGIHEPSRDRKPVEQCMGASAGARNRGLEQASTLTHLCRDEPLVQLAGSLLPAESELRSTSRSRSRSQGRQKLPDSGTPWDGQTDTCVGPLEPSLRRLSSTPAKPLASVHACSSSLFSTGEDSLPRQRVTASRRKSESFTSGLIINQRDGRS